MNYLDFELEIGAGRGRAYPVFVICSPAGEAHDFMKFPFDKQALENQLLALQTALLRSSGKHRKILSPEEQTVQNFGRALFDALFIEEVRSCYDVSQREAFHQDKGLRLKLRIQSPELASLPWEFLYDKRKAEYICFSSNTPIVRYLELPHPPQPLTVIPPLSILGVIASPKDLPELDIEREKHRVEKSLEMLLNEGLVKLTWLSSRTWQDLQRAMRSDTWHIFHFIGHGGFDTQADEGLIALEDEEGNASNLSATDLGRLLADHRSLRLIVLNSCDGARGSKHDIFSSTAAVLVRRGLPAVLAMQYEITDTAAIQLSRTFYETLADGLPVDTAVAEARKAICIGIKHTLEWGTPVLYMRSPDGVLFDLPQTRYNNTSTAIKTAAPSAPPIDEQISRWVQAKASKKRTEKSYEAHIKDYRTVLREHDLDLNSEDASVIPAIFQEWVGDSPKGTNIAANTYNQRVYILWSFYKFAVKQHWMKFNPLEMVKIREGENINAAMPIELEIIKNALNSIDRSKLEGKRNYALLCFLLTTGWRVSEVLSLLCCKIAVAESTVTIFSEQRKGKRMVDELQKGTAQALIDYLTAVYGNQWPSDAPVWLSFSRNESKGKAIKPSAVSKVCEKYLHTSKIEATRLTYLAMKDEVGVKGIEKLLQINTIR